jgi:putative Holliday junction resolvase
MNTARGRIMGIDMGDKRIGLAISDPSRTVASPAGFIQRRPGKRFPMQLLIDRARELEAAEFVIGLPLDENGEETERCAEVRKAAEDLERRTSLKVHLVDERFTTAAALRSIREMDGTVRGRKGDVDSLAATVLLRHAMELLAGGSDR